MQLRQKKHAAEPMNSRSVNRMIFDFLRRKTADALPQEKCVIVAFEEFVLEDIMPHGFNVPHDGDITAPKTCIVFTIRRVVGNVHQPVACVFYHGVQFVNLASCVRVFVHAVYLAGLRVVATVCPGSKTFIPCVCELAEVADLMSFEGPVVYTMGELGNVVHIFDPPTLLKDVRNLFAYHQVEFVKDGVTFVADWEHIHYWSELNEETKVKYEDLVVVSTENLKRTEFAAKVFSKTVCKGICTAIIEGLFKVTELGTAEFCLFFNNLFDTCNVSKTDRIGYRSRISTKSGHFKFWDESITILQSMRFIIYTNGVPLKQLRLKKHERKCFIENKKNSMKVSDSDDNQKPLKIIEGALKKCLSDEDDVITKSIEEDIPLTREKKKKYGTIASNSAKRNLLPEIMECEKVDSVSVNGTKDEVNGCEPQKDDRKPTKKNRRTETADEHLEKIISEARRLYNSTPKTERPTGTDIQTIVPECIRMWILNCRGFKTIVSNLRELGINDVHTRNFNVDNVHSYMHLIKVTNGMKNPVRVTENVEFPVLDDDMARRAFEPMVGCVILRSESAV